MKFRKTKKVVVISKKVDFLTEIVYLPLEFIIMLRFFEKKQIFEIGSWIAGGHSLQTSRSMRLRDNFDWL